MCFGPFFCWIVFLLICSSFTDVLLLSKHSHFVSLKMPFFLLCSWKVVLLGMQLYLTVIFFKHYEPINSLSPGISCCFWICCLCNGILLSLSFIFACFKDLLPALIAIYFIMLYKRLKIYLTSEVCVHVHVFVYVSDVQTINWVLDFVIIVHVLTCHFLKELPSYSPGTCAFLFLPFISWNVSYITSL